MRTTETLRIVRHGSRSRRAAQRRWLSATAGAAIAVGGYVHFCLYRRGYRAIPKIGTGFLLQVLASAIVASALLFIGRERLLRFGRIVVRRSFVLEALGLALSLGTLAAFAASRTPAGIFGFREGGLQPAPQALVALVAELAALVLLTGALILERRPPERVTWGRPPVPSGHARLFVGK